MPAPIFESPRIANVEYCETAKLAGPAQLAKVSRLQIVRKYVLAACLVLQLAFAFFASSALFVLVWLNADLSIGPESSPHFPSWATYAILAAGLISSIVLAVVGLTGKPPAPPEQEIVQLAAVSAVPALDEQALREKYYVECSAIIAKLAEQQRATFGHDKRDETAMIASNALAGAAGLLANYFKKPAVNPRFKNPFHSNEPHWS